MRLLLFYFVLYAFFVQLNLSYRTALPIFLGLYGFSAIWIVWRGVRWAKAAPRAEVVFWLAVSVLLLLPGAYLEFPSDPWEHVRRIFEWRDEISLRGHYHFERFGYFFTATLLSDVPAGYRREALGIYSAFTQLLVLTQVSFFFSRCKYSRPTVLTLTWIFLCFFGTHVFGLRYYALAATPLAYAAYWRSLGLCLGTGERNRFAYLEIPLLAFFMYWNHYQEAYFFGLSALGLAIARGLTAWPKWPSVRPVHIAAAFLIFCVLWVPIGFVLRASFPQWYSGEPGRLLTDWGALHFWRAGSPHMHTLALPGVVGLFLALFQFKQFPNLAALTLMPILVYFTPFLSPILLEANLTYLASYRLLYAFPATLFLGAWANSWWESRRYPRAVFVGLVSVLGAIPFSPIAGRLFAQLFVAPPARSLVHTDVVAEWVRENRIYSRSCSLIGDSATTTGVSAWLGRGSDETRRYPELYGLKIFDEATLRAELNKTFLCGFMVRSEDVELPPAASFLSRYGRHWSDSATEPVNLSPPAFGKALSLLEDWGWEKTRIPPFYFLYEPPLTVQVEAIPSTSSRLIKFPFGHTVLVNSGSQQGGVARYLLGQSIRYIDVMVILRPNPEDWEGLGSLSSAEIKISKIWLPPTVPDVLRTMVQRYERLGTQVQTTLGTATLYADDLASLVWTEGALQLQRNGKETSLTPSAETRPATPASFPETHPELIRP